MFSNTAIVLKNAKRYLGKDVNIQKSDKKGKKYMVEKPDGKFVSFGAVGYKDFTATGDKIKQSNYLKRSANIKGDWKKDKYSPNSLSRAILWR